MITCKKFGLLLDTDFKEDFICPRCGSEVGEENFEHLLPDIPEEPPVPPTLFPFDYRKLDKKFEPCL